MPHTSPESAVSHAKDRDVNSVVSLLSDAQWCIAKNGGGYMQRGVAKGLKVPYLFMITEVSIRCQKNPEVGIRRIPPNTPLVMPDSGEARSGNVCWVLKVIIVERPFRMSHYLVQ